MSGVSADYGYTSPLDARLTGININQSDEPWWYVAILNWISMVKQISNCIGKQGPSYRTRLKYTLEKGNPFDVYKIYEGYTGYMEQLDNGLKED